MKLYLRIIKMVTSVTTHKRNILNRRKFYPHHYRPWNVSSTSCLVVTKFDSFETDHIFRHPAKSGESFSFPFNSEMATKYRLPLVKDIFSVRNIFQFRHVSIFGSIRSSCVLAASVSSRGDLPVNALPDGASRIGNYIPYITGSAFMLD